MVQKGFDNELMKKINEKLTFPLLQVVELAHYNTCTMELIKVKQTLSLRQVFFTLMKFPLVKQKIFLNLKI